MAILGLFLMSQIYLQIVAPLIKRSSLKAQGVFFVDSPILTEVKAIKRFETEKPHHNIFCSVIEALAGGKRLPNVFGMCLPGRTVLFVNSVTHLEDFFIHQN